MIQKLVVFGATGNQGGSVINFVLNHNELSQNFKVRGITRDVSKPAAQKLISQGIEMVNCNIEDPSSIRSALEGADVIFAMTTGDYNTNTREYEFNQGKSIADAAVAAKAKYFIFSTLPNVSKNTEGKFSHAWHFDVKAEIEDYVRSLPIKSAFFSPGSFMQNCHTAYKPRRQEDGTYIIPSIEPSDSKHMPLIDIGDIGKYVGAVSSKPDEYAGKVLYGAVGLYSWNETADSISKVSGKTVKHKVLPEAVFRSFMDPVWVDELCDMMNYRYQYGYYGEGQERHLRWSKEQAIGDLTTLEEYLMKHPVDF